MITTKLKKVLGMLLPQHKLDQLDYYFYDNFTKEKFHSESYTVVKLVWERKFYEFWKRPTVLKFRCRTCQADSKVFSHVSGSADELIKQLNSWSMACKQQKESRTLKKLSKIL